MGHIVVGVDGSEGSRRALDHALDMARLRDTSLRVVTVYHAPVFAESAGTMSSAGGMSRGATVSPTYPSRSLEQHADLREAARQAQAAMAQEMVMHAQHGDVEIEIEAVSDGHPVKVLVDQAKDADALVVGSRGLGGMAGMLLGSVSAGCVRHARCPVTVVPDNRD